MNTYTSYIILQVLLIYILSKQNILVLEENDNILDHFRPYLDEESILKEPDIKKDYRDLVSKYLDIESHIKENLLGYTSQN